MEEVTVKFEIETQRTFLVDMDEEYADKLNAALGRALSALSHLDANSATYQSLVNTHTIDTLLAFRGALSRATDG
jgi:hypothetical protein